MHLLVMCKGQTGVGVRGQGPSRARRCRRSRWEEEEEEEEEEWEEEQQVGGGGRGVPWHVCLCDD